MKSRVSSGSKSGVSFSSDNPDVTVLSVSDSEAESLGRVLSQDRARLIVDFLADNPSSSASVISSSLNLPLSTVNYYLRSLSKAGLVVSDEFHYSPKGREVPLYSLSNKVIVVVPSRDHSFVSVLKALVPGFVSLFFVGFLVYLFRFFSSSFRKSDLLTMSAKSFVKDSSVSYSSVPVSSVSSAGFSSVPWWGWFFLGGFVVLLGFLFWSFFRRKRHL